MKAWKERLLQCEHLNMLDCTMVRSCFSRSTDTSTSCSSVLINRGDMEKVELIVEKYNSGSTVQLSERYAPDIRGKVEED